MKRIVAPMMALVMTMAQCACGGSASGDSDVKYVKKKGKLVVGMTDFAPMDDKNDAGEWIGFDADMAKAFAVEDGSAGAEALDIEGIAYTAVDTQPDIFQNYAAAADQAHCSPHGQ